MAMEEFDPITIKITTTFDRRFAQFYFASDNSPQEPDGSIPIRGQVSFGVRRQPGRNGRAYRIGVRSAFLEIKLVQCRFEPNLAREKKIQDGAYKERSSSERERGHEMNAGADASGSAALNAPKAGAGAKASAALRKKGKQSDKGERQFERYRLRWEAGGWRFGDMTHGDLYDPEGILRGPFLQDGDWGRLIPDRDAAKYGARIVLLVQEGMLAVTPESPHWMEKFIDQSERQEADAFNALKAAVAGWVLENELSTSSHPNGFDEEQKELVLARGDVAVDLSRLTGGETPQMCLASSKADAPTLAAPREKVKTTCERRKTPSKACDDE
jgi:hypothetical protein